MAPTDSPSPSPCSAPSMIAVLRNPVERAISHYFHEKRKGREPLPILRAFEAEEKSLFYYKNSFGRQNFYIKQDTGFNLLIYKSYLKQLDGKSVKTENRTYCEGLFSVTLDGNRCTLRIVETEDGIVYSIPSRQERVVYQQIEDELKRFLTMPRLSYDQAENKIKLITEFRATLMFLRYSGK